jgi:ketosteroid isomerase-like protein
MLTMTMTPSAFGQTTGQQGEPRNESEQQILALEREWYEAREKRDVKSLEQLLADDATLINPLGQFGDKQRVLKALGVGGTTILESYTLEEVKVRLYGNTAVTTGRATVKGQTGVGDFSGATRFTRVYVQRNGRWQLVAHQGTRITEPKGQ